MARKLRNGAKAKRFTGKAIDAKLRALRPRPRPATAQRLHQKVCFLLGVTRRQYLFFADMGLGKTKISLDLAEFWQARGDVKRVLVLVPNTSNVYSWVKEVKRHAPGLSVVGLDDRRAGDRRRAFESGAVVVVATYAGWLRFVTKNVRVRKGDDEVGKLVIDKRAARACESQFQMVVFDEVTAAQNHQSLTHRACRRLARHCEFRYGLTGTPFGKDPEDLWGQFYLIDQGETLGPTLGIYRAAYFNEVEDVYAGVKYVFDRRKSKLLHRALRNRSIRYTKEECLDLPPKTFSVREVVLPHTVEVYMRQITEQLAEAGGNARLVENAFHRMRTICSGWMSFKDPEGGTGAIDFHERRKEEALLDLLDEIGPREKVVVFHHYTHTGELLAKAMGERVPHVWLYGKTRDRAGVQRSFDEDPDVRVMLASSAGAYGLNLQVARYVVLYETPTDPKVRKQMIDRVHRMGQDRPVFVYDIIVRKSIETKILAAIRDGDNLFAEVMAGRRSLTGR